MNKPTDAEIDAAWRESVAKHERTTAFVRDFARAVLAKWGTPAPVEWEPLTDEQIKDLQDDGVFLGSCRQIVRVIEAAHGIKGGQHG